MATKKKILSYLNKNGLVFYGMIQRKHLSLAKLTNYINENDLENIEKICKLHAKEDYTYYSNRYSKLDCLDEVLDYDKEKYTHLRSIRDVVQMDNIVNAIIDDKLHHEAISFYYLRLLFNKLFDYNRDLELIYDVMLDEEKKEFFDKVMKSIDNYYIGVITK